MEGNIIKNKSVRYQKKTLLKLPLQTAVTATGDYPIPEVVLIPSSRNNSVVPQHEDEEDDEVIHLVLTPSHSLPLPSEERKVSVMSLLSFIANGSNRPSIFSQFRWTAIFNSIIIPATFKYDFLEGK